MEPGRNKVLSAVTGVRFSTSENPKPLAKISLPSFTTEMVRSCDVLAPQLRRHHPIEKCFDVGASQFVFICRTGWASLVSAAGESWPI